MKTQIPQETQSRPQDRQPHERKESQAKYPQLLYDMADGPHDWYTPKYILDALGPFNLDPCAPPKHKRPFDTAKIHYTLRDDGLSQPWIGRVWLNPPYDNKIPWMKAMALHRNGIALVYNRLGRKWFDQIVMPYTTGILSIGTVKFLKPDRTTKGYSPQPCVLIAYDPLELGDVPPHNWSALKSSGLPGIFVDRLGHWLKARKERTQQR